MQSVALCAATLSSLPKIVSPSFIDPHTPKSALATHSLESHKREYQIVMSDEFNSGGRTFDDGHDPIWTALDKNDYTNAALHFYKPENVRTKNGNLEIITNRKENTFRAENIKKKKYELKTKHYQSGMIQSWNKFCFTGGALELTLQLPGHPFIGGLWPAAWMLGNLARATYVASSDYMWPWSYSKCTRATRVSQEISACSKNSHYGLQSAKGRGAPEIDVLEAMPGESTPLPHTKTTKPYMSTSLQISPGVAEGRPVLGQRPLPHHWYTGMTYGLNTTLNPFFYGVTLEHSPASYTYQSDAISANTNLGMTHFNSMHTYRVEWEPADNEGEGGHIKWYLDGEFLYGIEADNLDITGSTIPAEPMYVLINTAMSSTWGFPLPLPDSCKCESYDCDDPDCKCAFPPGFCENFPATFKVDSVRVYQDPTNSKHTLSCSPPSHPTHQFIKGHEERFYEGPATQPLQPVMIGGGKCDTSADCGNEGKCVDNLCKCRQGLVGPNCLMFDAYYEPDVAIDVGDENAKIKQYAVYVPQGLLLAFGAILLWFGIQLRLRVQERKRLRQYMPVSSTEESSRVQANPGRSVYNAI